MLSFINEARVEYWQNIGRQNNLLAFVASVRNRFLVVRNRFLLLPVPLPEAFLRVLRFFPLLKKNNNNISNFHFDLKRTINFKQFLD